MTHRFAHAFAASATDLVAGVAVRANPVAVVVPAVAVLAVVQVVAVVTGAP